MHKIKQVPQKDKTLKVYISLYPPPLYLGKEDVVYSILTDFHFFNPFEDTAYEHLLKHST